MTYVDPWYLRWCIVLTRARQARHTYAPQCFFIQDLVTHFMLLTFQPLGRPNIHALIRLYMLRQRWKTKTTFRDTYSCDVMMVWVFVSLKMDLCLAVFTFRDVWSVCYFKELTNDFLIFQIWRSSGFTSLELTKGLLIRPQFASFADWDCIVIAYTAFRLTQGITIFKERPWDYTASVFEMHLYWISTGHFLMYDI